MFAYRRHYVKQNEYQKPEERYQVSVTRGGKPVGGVKPADVSRVEEEVMYWRKANHIHRWFVDNVQEGIDDCKAYYVDEEKLKELLNVCNKVIEASELVPGSEKASVALDVNHQYGVAQWAPGLVIADSTIAEQLLPVCAGFFFGSCEYDEYYLQDVIDTRDWITLMLGELPGLSDASIYYQSNW